VAYERRVKRRERARTSASSAYSGTAPPLETEAPQISSMNTPASNSSQSQAISLKPSATSFRLPTVAGPSSAPDTAAI